MKHYTLKGELREVPGKGNKAQIKAYRRGGLVPCNLYGNGRKNTLFTVSEKDLNILLSNPSSFIIDLNLSDGTTVTAIPHEFQFHPVSDRPLHVDFLEVTEDKPIAINVPLQFVGHSIGVQQGGKFFSLVRQLRVSGLMKDLPDVLTIDISGLRLEKRIVAGDLKFDNISIISPKTTIVCVCRSTRQIAAHEAYEEAHEGLTPPPAEAAATDAAAGTDAAAAGAAAAPAAPAK